jgi:putative polyhydroxyalkanoate system protein
MAKLTIKVDHTLGTAEAMRLLRAAAEAHQKKVSGFVNSAVWSENSLHVDGKGFSGDIRVADRDVTVDADLGFPASLMPMKIQKEAEAWLRSVLGTT